MARSTKKKPKPALGTNPKDLIGNTKVPLSAFPAVAVAHGAHAMVDGRDKYGPWNWRDNSVVADIYIDAAKRHLDNWFERQDTAKDSEVHHLGHALACIGIILDAEMTGNLVDNRPPKSNGDLDAVFDKINAIIKRRKEAAAPKKRKR